MIQLHLAYLSSTSILNSIGPELDSLLLHPLKKESLLPVLIYHDGRPVNIHDLLAIQLKTSTLSSKSLLDKCMEGQTKILGLFSKISTPKKVATKEKEEGKFIELSTEESKQHSVVGAVTLNKMALNKMG